MTEAWLTDTSPAAPLSGTFPSARVNGWYTDISPIEQKTCSLLDGQIACRQMSAKKRGRPPSGNEPRDAQVYFALTTEDAEWLNEVSEALGFRNRGQMLTAIMERLIIAQLAPFAWLKVAWQIAGRAQETRSSQSAGLWNPFRERIPPLDPAEFVGPPRPPSALPDEDLAPAQTKLLEQVRKQTPQIR